MRLVLTLLAIAGAIAAAPATAPAQRVEPVAGMVGEADAIVTGPDGALWASQPDDPGRIARITTGGEVTYAAVGGISGLPVNRGPAGITRHGDALWFTLARGPETFAQLVPRGATSRFSLSYGRPTSLADGPDGALWMTVEGGNGLPDAILRRDPGESFFMLGADVDPHAIVAGRDGALWFLENGRIGRATTDGVITYQSVGATPTALAVGPDGALWYAQGATVRRLGDPTVHAIGTPASALTAGADGAVWAAVRGGLARIVPGEAPTFVREGIDPAAQGRALTASPDGHLWLTLDRAPYLVRITLPLPPTGTPTPSATPPPPPTASPEPTPGPTPTPTGAVEGKSVEVRVLSGTIRYRVPPETDYTRIAGRATLPLGVLLDSEAGRLRLISQVDGAAQFGDFNGGKFTVTQTSTGMTELALAGPLSCTRADRAKAVASQKKKKKTRSIWGKDSGGSFRTRGNGSVATVRGTEWRTEDTCAGTTVYVREGAVSVWPRRGGRSKLVRAGQRFFAPRPR